MGLLQVTPNSALPPPRRAVPGPGALPLAWRLLQHQHRGPGGLPWPGQSAQVPGGAGCVVGGSRGVQGQGRKHPKPGSEPLHLQVKIEKEKVYVRASKQVRVWLGLR